MAAVGPALARIPGIGSERHAHALLRFLVVHPHACFTVLLGHLPTPKQLLEGRL